MYPKHSIFLGMKRGVFNIISSLHNNNNLVTPAGVEGGGGGGSFHVKEDRIPFEKLVF